MTLRTWIGLLCLGLCGAGCGDTVSKDSGGSCSADTTVLCICPGPTISKQLCEDGAPGECDCSNPINPGECRDDGSPAACICDDDQIGEQTCGDGGAGECRCPDAIPPEQCRTDLDCADGVFCNGVERCDPTADGADGRGCTPPDSAPRCDDGIDCTVDSCSNVRDSCVFEAPDADGDGHRDANCVTSDGEPLGDDCDDSDDMRYPGNHEICVDGNFTHDEDCDDTTFGKLDLDGDGATDDRCCNGDNCGLDCDDTTIAKRVGQPEFCDNKDNDCDGAIDEVDNKVPWYIDADGDGFGGIATQDEAIEQCAPIPGRSLLATDCDDADPGKHPAQLERCDLRDNNCNLIADEDAMCPYEPFAVAPDDGSGVDVPVDPVCPPYGYRDSDGDGYGDATTQVELDPEAENCGLPADWVTKAGDCADAVSSRNPGMLDICDGIDNDCDDSTDEEPVASASCEIPNIDSMCVQTKCVPVDGAVCPAPSADCDSLPGCEADTLTNPSHCGGCNMGCGLGDRCIDSKCETSPYLELVSGSNFTLVRRTGGLVGWGRSSKFQLGTGGNVLSPQRVGTFSGVSQITGGSEFACAREGGAVRCWGSNSNSRLGGGSNVGSTSGAPIPVVGMQDAVLVRAGGDHACAIREDKTAWCWGSGGRGQLGYDPVAKDTKSSPVEVYGVNNAIDIGMGDVFTCLLHEERVVTCFGERDNGRLGNPSLTQDTGIPVLVTSLEGVERMAIGSGSNNHMCAILQITGEVVCWGYGGFGELGNGTSGDATTFTTFQGVSNVVEVALGSNHSCVVEADGDLWCVGRNDSGQLGVVSGNISIARKVDLGNDKAKSVSCGATHTCALLESGRIVCFGTNTYGQIGNGEASSSLVNPYYVTMPAP